MSNFSNTQHYKIVNAIHFSFFERKRLSIDRQNGSNSLQNIANQKKLIFWTRNALEPHLKLSKTQFKILQLTKFTIFRFENS